MINESFKSLEWLAEEVREIKKAESEKHIAVIKKDLTLNEDLKNKVEELEGQLAYECGCNSELVDTQNKCEILEKENQMLKALIKHLRPSFLLSDFDNYYHIIIEDGKAVDKQQYELINKILQNKS